jgi:hypothetical protein
LDAGDFVSRSSLPQLLHNLHLEIESKLSIARGSLAHTSLKGDASEAIWKALLRSHLPQRYAIESAHVVDSDGAFSEQIDVLVFDRQYSPFIFQFQGQTVVPAESVYAAFEAKQTLDAKNVAYARKKLLSVRRLKRTSLPIPHAGGTFDPKPPAPILGGLLTLDSEWKPPLGDAIMNSLVGESSIDQLDIGCVAAHGAFWTSGANSYDLVPTKAAATTFLLELIARLQTLGTVPMVDVRAYSRWLKV